MPCRIIKMVSYYFERCVLWLRAQKISCLSHCFFLLMQMKIALQKLLKHYPEVHDKIASLLQRMGMMLFRSGNLERALLYLNKSGDINRQLGGDQEHHLIPTLFVVGNIHRILGHDEDAENAWRDAYDVFGSIKGGSSYLYPEIKGSLTELLNARRGNV